jgi:hypothetical protein
MYLNQIFEDSGSASPIINLLKHMVTKYTNSNIKILSMNCVYIYSGFDESPFCNRRYRDARVRRNEKDKHMMGERVNVSPCR